MEENGKKDVTLYVAGGIGLLAVLALLFRNGGSGGGAQVIQENPASVAAVANAAASEANSQAAEAVGLKQTSAAVTINQRDNATARIVGLAQISAAQRVALTQARDSLDVGLSSIRNATKQTRINARTSLEITKAQAAGQNTLSQLEAELQAILAWISLGGSSPVASPPSGGTPPPYATWGGQPPSLTAQWFPWLGVNDPATNYHNGKQDQVGQN